MKIAFYLLILSSFLVNENLFAQHTDKLNNWLRYELNQKNTDSEADQPIDLLVKGELSTIQRQVEILGGHYKFGVEDIASIRIPESAVRQLESDPAVQYIAYFNYKPEALYDNLTFNNNLDSVHQNLGDLPSGLTGKGVVVGVIDNGLDWEHPDFQKTDGSTRIRYLWDQRREGNSNLNSFNYGYEWDSTSIDNGLIDHNPEVGFGHGTGVSGLAVGNGNAVNRYVGAAPDAEIVFVNIGDGSFVPQFIDGMAYIFEKAEELGMPCVINSSLGYYGGAHDTRGLDVQLAENLLNESPGRVLVQACGNGALSELHLGYDVESDTSLTFLRHTTVFDQVIFEAYADEADFNNVWFSIGLRHRQTLEQFGQTPFVNLLNDFNLPNNYSVDSLVTDFVTPTDSFRVRLTIQRVDGVYEMLFEATETNNNSFMELRTTGTGKFDIWSHKNRMGTSDIIHQPSLLPDVNELADMAFYKFPDTLQTIVGGWNCSPEVISVANYSNADSWDTWNGTVVQNSVPYQAHVWDSSTGPTRTGDQKPDIGASGNFTFSAATLNNLATLKVNNPEKVSPEGWHAVFAGTSAAAPVVTGAIACYFELFPDADHIMIKQAIESSAKVDNFVQLKGDAPNLAFGYGKLDAYQFIRSNVRYGCTDSQASNYDPEANFDDGSCLLTSLISLEEAGIEIAVNPNPSDGSFWIDYSFEQHQDLDYRLMDLLGQTLGSGTLASNEGLYSLNLQEFAAGMYLFQVLVDGNAIESIKLIRK